MIYPILLYEEKNPEKQFAYMVSYFSRTDSLRREPPFAEPFLFLLVAVTSIAT